MMVGNKEQQKEEEEGQITIHPRQYCSGVCVIQLTEGRRRGGRGCLNKFGKLGVCFIARASLGFKDPSCVFCCFLAF